MMGFNRDHDPYHNAIPTDDPATGRRQQWSDRIPYGLVHEPALATSTTSADATSPLESPDLLPPCSSVSESRSSSFSLSRSSSFSVPTLGTTASPSLAEVFLRGPSTEKAALQQYLMNLADTVSRSVGGGTGQASHKRKRKSGDDKKKRKSRRSSASGERTKRSAEKGTAAEKTKATATVAEITTPPAATSTSTSISTPNAVPLSSPPSLYYSSMPSPCSSFSCSSSSSSFSTGHYTPISTPTLPSTPAPSYYYPNILFDAPVAPSVSTPPVACHSFEPCHQAPYQPLVSRYEDDDFWLDVEAAMPTVGVANQHHFQQQQQRDAFFDPSFCELERFLLEHDF
jgi:hypothetical protein